MKQFKIYTIGNMDGVVIDEQMGWRLSIEHLIKERSSENITFVHPPIYCNYYMNEFKNKQEEKAWRLHQIQDSDIVIVNMKNIDDNVDAYYELGYIDAVNAMCNKHIYIVGVGKPISENSLAWASLFRHEETLESAAEYVASHLLL